MFSLPFKNYKDIETHEMTLYNDIQLHDFKDTVSNIRIYTAIV